MSYSKAKAARGNGGHLATAVTNIGAHLKSGGADPKNTQLMIATESSDADVVMLNNAIGNAESDLAGVLFGNDDGYNVNTPEGKRRRDVALEAASITALAYGAPAEYAEAALTRVATEAHGVTLVNGSIFGSAGSVDYRDQVVPALEAFNEQELRNTMPYSILFNAFGARQDDFSEMFFPTVVVGPDQPGLDLTVSRPTVYTTFRHNRSGKALANEKRNLIDAVVDPTILSDEHTRLVPAKTDDGFADAVFLPDTAGADAVFRIAGVDVPTAPLLMNNEVDLLGVSGFAPLLGNGILNESDDIGPRVVLENIYVQPKDSPVVIKFPVARLPRTAFNKTVEGNSYEMNLQFPARDLVLDGDTLDVAGDAVDELAAIGAGNFTVRIGADINGTLNVEFANLNIYSSGVTVTEILNADGVPQSTTSGPGAAIAAAVRELKVVAYDVQAYRTNVNKRTRGHLLDVVTETERYMIPLGSPISIPSPVTSSREASDLKSLITAARIRNSNNAVTQLLNYAETLKAYVKGPKRQAGVIPQLPGMGRLIVQPFFEERTLDLALSINSIRSGDRAQDVSSTLVNAIRDVAYRMYCDSRYQAALDSITQGSGETPTLLVGTDPILVRHLIVSGDTRTFGQSFDQAVVKSTLDERMKNKIIVTLSRGKVEGPDPMTFGTHAWIPELTSTINLSREGATYKETMVQPRNLHQPHLPVMAIIHVKNLSKALVDRTAAPAAATLVPNPYLAGLYVP